MTIARKIIDKFGGPATLARALGHSGRTTVASWASRGSIPAKQQQAVLDAARRLSVDLDPADFFDHADTVPAAGNAVDSHTPPEKIAGAA